MKKLNRQQYERPEGKFKCGRAACWEKPCFNGPKLDGTCGGVTECTPVRKGDRWECCRTAAAGGPCSSGPKPDGTCSQMQPPCVPRLTMRAQRGRLAWLAAAIVLAGILTWFHFGSKTGSIGAVNPGPLSAKHQNIALLVFGDSKKAHGGAAGSEENCSECHRAHSAGAAGWIAAAFQPSKMSDQCLNCHRFGNASDMTIQKKAHNEVFAKEGNAAEAQCQLCHTEHHGATASLTDITDAQCNTCHTKSIKSFAKNHPQFPDNFPHKEFSAVAFDHAEHATKHFKPGEFKCGDCHNSNTGTRQINTVSFEVGCVRCHLADLGKSDLVLLRLPEKLNQAATAQTTFTKLIFKDGVGLDGFLREIGKSGNALQTRLQTATGKAGLDTLFRGIKWEGVAAPAALVAGNKAVDTASLPSAGDGWYWNTDNADLLPELHYRAIAHADPVMKAWLEFSLNASPEFRDELLNRKSGAGGCAMCHVATDGKTPQIAFRYRRPQVTAHTTFSHGAHLKLVDCATCHVMDSKAELADQFAGKTSLVKDGARPVSSFKSIQREVCAQCHAEQKIRQDCRLCHVYHLEPTLLRPGTGGVTLATIALQPAPTAAASAKETEQKPPAADDGTAKAQAAAQVQAAEEQAAKDQAAKDLAAKEQAAKDQAAKDQAAKAQAAKEQAAQAQLAKDAAAKEQVTKAQPVVVASASPPAAPPPVATPAAAPVAPAAPRFHGSFIGNAECVNCHTAEKEVWENTKHNKSWDIRRLAGKSPVKEILAAVGSTQKIPSNEPICSNCHFTVVDSKAAMGVSCESCHGAASEWKAIHNLAQNDKSKHVQQMEAARQKGMINSGMKQELIQNCLGCHNYDSGAVGGAVIAKMWEAGHPHVPFEFVEFSQGSVRHRFYPPDTSVNAAMSPVELARWFVIGQGAQLVSSAKVLQASAGVDAIKTDQQTKIENATKVLTLSGLAEAKTLIASPTDDNLRKLIAACEGKDFSGALGGMVPKEFK